MLSVESMRAGRAAGASGAEAKDFATLREFRVATMALDNCVRQIFPWNMSFAVLTIFLTSNDFGVAELASATDRLEFLSDFVDSVIQHNAQCWDKERPYMSALEVLAHWSTAMVRRGARSASKTAADEGSKKGGSGGNKENHRGQRFQPRGPPGVCLDFNNAKCSHKGDKYSDPKDAAYVLRHLCSKFLTRQEAVLHGQPCKGRAQVRGASRKNGGGEVLWSGGINSQCLRSKSFNRQNKFILQLVAWIFPVCEKLCKII